ncbi:MAG: hypothetical protein KAS39_02445, partial [Actinomycetia bacterium]|nr:hypothetical protein [Actinomycetes bacterium]
TNLFNGRSYYYRIAPRNNRGYLGSYSLGKKFTIHGTSRIIDGDPSDWLVAPPKYDNIAVINSGEWVWRDREGDHRMDGDFTDKNYDLTELRITSDSESIYFLATFDGVSQEPYDLGMLSLSFDTNLDESGIGNTWLADDSGILVTDSAAWERTLTITRYGLWFFASDSDEWYQLPGTKYENSSMNNCYEFSVLKKDIGLLSGSGSMRITAAVGQLIYGLSDSDPNTKDITKNFGECDLLDTLTKSMSNTWGGAVGTGDPVINYSIDLRVTERNGLYDTLADKPVIIEPSGNYLKKSLKFNWNRAVDPDFGDEIRQYYFTVDENINFSEDSHAFFVMPTISNITSISYNSDLIRGKKYYWKVAAVDSSGVIGNFSDIAEFILPFFIEKAVGGIVSYPNGTVIDFEPYDLAHDSFIFIDSVITNTNVINNADLKAFSESSILL